MNFNILLFGENKKFFNSSCWCGWCERLSYLDAVSGVGRAGGGFRQARIDDCGLLCEIW